MTHYLLRSTCKSFQSFSRKIDMIINYLCCFLKCKCNRHSTLLDIFIQNSLIIDLLGYIGSVTAIKKNQTKTRECFTVFLKTSPIDVTRLMVSNHQEIEKILSRFSNLIFSTTKNLFNSYSKVVPATDMMDFGINDTDAIPSCC